MQRRSGEALQRDRYRGRSKPSVTPGDNPEPTEVEDSDEFIAALGNSSVAAVKLTGDISLSPSQSYSIARSLELDLNGHEMTASYASAPLFSVTDDATLDIKGNGTITNTGCIAIASDDGEIIIENGTFSSTANEAFLVGEDGSITVNGGTITGQNGAIISNAPNGEIVVNGGVLEGLDNYAIATDKASGNGGNYIEINGGRIIGNISTEGYEAVGVYIANDDTFVMNDGEIIANGGTGLCLRAGNATINDGSITATGVDKNGDTVADGFIGDTEVVMEGVAAIVYHQSAGYPGNSNMYLTVNGGTITGVDYSIQVLSEEEEPAVTVTGGTLTPVYPPVESGNGEPEQQQEPAQPEQQQEP